MVGLHYVVLYRKAELSLHGNAAGKATLHAYKFPLFSICEIIHTHVSLRGHGLMCSGRSRRGAVPLEEAVRRLVSISRRSTAIPAPKHRPPKVATLARSQRSREAPPAGKIKCAAGQSVALA